MTDTSLFARYDVPIPRYTSYPTVPQWATTPSPAEWRAALTRAAADADASLSLYVHLPFCESLCSFCGCNTVITRDRSRQDPYVDAVLAELDAYVRLVPALGDQPLEQLHLGGGTPTFLSPASLARLVDGISARLPRGASVPGGAPAQLDFEGSVEIDPRVTTSEQLAVLRDRGFTRVSMGVQDTDPDVQRLVNRHQPVALTEALCHDARRLGFTSINLDLIYGLPGQTRSSMDRLVDHVLRLSPDRLAVYSFARVPWIKPAQRRFTDEQIPAGAEKRALYDAVRTPLLDAGYLEIGMDHFARPGDSLARAAAGARLHRNFMGYTEVRTTTLLGLGVSAISETPDCYHQNEKVITKYEAAASQGAIPTFRGHLLSPDDRRRREQIASLMTRFSTTFAPAEVDRERLLQLAADGLVHVDGGRLTVLPIGRAFLRNIAAVFDGYLGRHGDERPLYSRAT